MAMSDKIAEIRARYAGYSLNSGNAGKANEDRGWLLAEVDRQRAEIERLIRLKKLLDRNEREFLAAIGLATTTVLGPGHDPSLALSSMRLVLAKFEKLRAENERLSEALREALSGLRYRRRKKK